MPGVAEGYRVQCLIDATRRAHAMDRRRPAGRASVTISMGVWKKCPSCGTRWISARCCRQLNAEVYMPNSALFLDRDGVVNVDRGYIHRSEQFEFVPGIFDLARFWTNELRRPIVVVTNQSGIGRGYFDERAYADLTRWMCDRFEAEGTAIARVYHCPYHPQDGIGEYRCDHPWRKPKPGMLSQAVSDLGLDPAHCAILGDKISDIEAGAAAGIGLLVRIGSRDAKMAEPLHDVVADLREALALFRFHFRSHFATAVPDQRRRHP